MNKRPKVPTYCFFKGSYNPLYEQEIAKTKDKCYQYNKLNPNDTNKQKEILKSLLGKMGDNVIITPPFWCDYGYNIEIGNNFYANHNLIITDGTSVIIKDDVFIGPNCCLTTAEHAIDPTLRKQGIEIAKPITIGNNVWLGAGCIILAGVEIGDNSVIGAGSVVTKNIPSNVVAVGVPCKVLRKITPEDAKSYPFYNEESK